MNRSKLTVVRMCNFILDMINAIRFAKLNIDFKLEN